MLDGTGNYNRCWQCSQVHIVRRICTVQFSNNCSEIFEKVWACSGRTWTVLGEPELDNGRLTGLWKYTVGDSRISSRYDGITLVPELSWQRLLAQLIEKMLSDIFRTIDYRLIRNDWLAQTRSTFHWGKLTSVESYNARSFDRKGNPECDASDHWRRGWIDWLSEIGTSVIGYYLGSGIGPHGAHWRVREGSRRMEETAWNLRRTEYQKSNVTVRKTFNVTASGLWRSRQECTGN